MILSLWKKIKFEEIPIILKQLVFSYFTQGVWYLSSLLTIALITRSMSVENYGVFVILKGFGEFTAYVAGMGLGAYMSRELPNQTPMEQSKILNYCLKNELKFFFVLSIFVAVFAWPFSKVFNIEGYSLHLILFVSGFGFWLVFNEIGRFHAYAKRIRTSASLLAGGKVLFALIIGILFLNFNGKLSITVICGATISGFIIMTAISLSTLPKEFFSIPISVKSDDSLIKVLFTNKYFLLIEFSSLLFLLMDRFWLTSWHGPQTAGSYVYAMSWIILISRFSTNIYEVSYPYFAEYFKKRDRVRTIKSFVFSVGTGIFLILIGCAILFAFSPWLINLVSGKEYLVSIPLIRGLIFIPVLLLVNALGIHILILLKAEKVVGLTLFFFVFIKLLLSFLLIPTWKADGAVWVNNLAYILLSIVWVVETIYFLRLKSQSFRNIFDKLMLKDRTKTLFEEKNNFKSDD